MILADSRLSQRLVAIRRSLLQKKHFSVHAIYRQLNASE